MPKQWENTYFAWMRGIEPWCISRQLWWGHRIPAWYGPDSTVFVARTEQEAREAARQRYGADMPLDQDEDVLDTWFSSALWPFSTLGWPEQTPELALSFERNDRQDFSAPRELCHRESPSIQTTRRWFIWN